MSHPEIARVNDAGEDYRGDLYTFRVHPHKLREGLMVEVPVLIQYPNGRVAQSHRIMVTPKGREVMKRTVPVGIKKPEGSA